MFVNKYSGRCSNKNCSKAVYDGVPAGTGFTEKKDGRYITWCRDCVPARIETAPVESNRRELTADGKVFTPYEPANLPLVKAMPGARFVDKFNGGPYWSVSLEMGDRDRLLELADKLKLTVPDSLRTVTVTEQAIAADTAGLYPFQVQGVNWMALRDKALLGDDMGTGKTVQALRALPKDARCLCVVPACVKFNWRDECNKWRPDLEAVVLSGKTAFRWPAPGQVVIINYDVLPEWLTPPTRKKGEPWIPAPVPDADRQAAKGVTLICDEVHYAKNFKAKRSKKVKSLTGIVSKVWALTGTPLLNRPSDLFGVLDSVGMAHTVFGSWKRFMQLFNACEDRWGGIAWGSPEPIVPELLRRVMLRRTRAEVLPDLPNKTYSTIVLNDIPASLRKKMDSAWEEFGDVIDATDELPPFEQFSAIRADLAESRIEAVTEYVENCEEQEVPLVVFCVHRAPIDALATRPGWATITGDTKPEDRQNVVRRFQAGELKGVGLTIAAGGVGLTLTRAWRELFVDLDWTPANNLQAEDRCCRIGQESDKVEIVRMVSDHILDQHVLKLLDAKMAVIRASIDGTVKAVAPAVVSESVPAVSETEEEFAARMAKLEEARKASEENAALVAKNQAKTKTERIHGRLKDKAEVKEMPEGLTDDVRAAFRYMLGVCDGAEKRDGQGFNKPDAMLAHYVLASGLETPQEVEAAYFLMVPKYRGQLSGEFPKLFPAKVRKPRAKKVSVPEGVTA